MMAKPFVSPCYCINLRRAAGAVTDFYENTFDELGLSVAQYYLLKSLSRLAPVTTTRLAEEVGLERSTLVRNMRVLQKNGWVDDVSGSLKHQFQLSGKGHVLLSQAVPLWEKAQSGFVEKLGQEDTAELMRLLRKVQDMKDRVGKSEGTKND